MNVNDLPDHDQVRAARYAADPKYAALHDQFELGRIDFDRNFVGLSDIRIGHRVEGGPGDVLRAFSADVLDGDRLESPTIGTVSGWIGWRIENADLADAGDRVDGLAYRLGIVAADILQRAEHLRAEKLIKDVVFVGHLEIEPGYRGQRITRWLLDDLMDALRLDERTTLVVMGPEPGGWGSGRMSPGADHDAARDRLLDALREQGFRPWDANARDFVAGVWWLPMPEYEIAAS